MSLAGFEKEVASSPQVGENDRVWFPRWIRRYALNFRKGLVADLPVNEHSVIRFSKGLLKNGAPAWQRWQAVRAVECYRDLVLHRCEPDLSYVISTLARLGCRRRND